MSETAQSSARMVGAIPCPFCGGTRILAGYKYCAICVDCGATGPDKEHSGDALKAWNTRKSVDDLWQPSSEGAKK